MAQAEIFTINVQPIVDQMKVLGTAIGETKDKLSKLTEEEKKTTDEGIRLTTELKAQQKEYNSLNTVVANQTSALKEVAKATETNTDLMNLSSNSIATNRKLYNALYGEIVNTTTATKAERDALNQKIEVAKKVNDKLKEQEKQLGDTRRNVGNYAESLQSVIGGLTSAIPATEGLSKAQKGVNLVMSANPIGGIITLLFALKDIFSSNAMVADQLTFALDGINNALQFVIDVIVDTVTNFDKLSTAIANPFAFFYDLGKGALQAGKDGFEASRQLDVLTESIGASTLAIEKNNIAIETNKTVLLNKKRSDAERIQASKEIIKLENENTEKLIANATAELNSEKLKLKSKIKNNQLSAQEIQKLALLEAKIEKTKAEGIANIRKAENENYKILYGEQEELAKKNAELAKQRREKEAQELKQQREKELQELKQYNAKVLGLQDEFLLSERDKIAKSYQDKIALIKGNSAEELRLILAIQAEQEAKLKAFDEKVAKERLDAERATIEKELGLSKLKMDNAILQAETEIKDKEALEAEKLRISIFYAQRQLDLAKQMAIVDGNMTDEEIQNIERLRLEIIKLQNTISGGESGSDKPKTVAETLGIDQAQMAEASDALNMLQGIFSNVASVVDGIYQRQIQDIDDKRDAEIRAIEESGASEESKQKKIEALNKKYAMEKYEREKEAFYVSKAIQIVQATIATALAVIQGLSAGFSTGPAGIALGPALAASAGIAGGVQIALIASQKPPPPPKFAKGVIGLRGEGTATSDSIDAKLSRGESVMTAKATEAFAHELAMMELAVGNKPNFQFGSGKFSTGYIPTGDGGFSSRQTAQSSFNNVAMAETVANAVMKIPAPVLEYSEFQRFTSGVNKSVQISEL